MIQDSTLNEIIDLNKINNNILIDIIVKNTIPNIFRDLKEEKKLDYSNIRSFIHNYENIEKELGSLLLPGLRKFKTDDPIQDPSGFLGLDQIHIDRPGFFKRF